LKDIKLHKCAALLMKMQLNDIFKHGDHKNTAYVHVNFTT